MKFNIFRNPYVDAQVGMLLGSFDDSVRNQTEQYWRDKISQEIASYAVGTNYEGLTLDQLNILFKIANKVKTGTK